jgi:hypothetical protein
MAEFSEAIIKIIDKKIKTIDTANLDLYDQLNDVEKLIFEDLKKAINKLNVEGGKIQFDDKNIDLVNSLDKVMIESIQRSTMPSAITKYLRNFQTISDFNYDVHKDVNDLSKAELEKLVSPVQKLAVETTLDGLTGSGVNTNFVEPVRQGIFKNIVAGTNRTQLEEYLSNYVLGNPNVDGLYSRYIKQISRDALGQFDGQTNAKIANEYGLDAFRYVGSLIDDSRPQCVRWVGKRVLQTSELQSEINWANNNGTGMISGTTIDNFAVFRGGYNCRHAAIPFKLTKSQREKLELEQSKVETKVDQQITEVLDDANKTQQKNQSVNKKNEFNSEFLATTQSKSIQKNFLDLVNGQDGAAEISNEKKTVVGLLDESQRLNPSSNLNSDLWKSKQQINPKQIAKVPKDANGVCYTDNSMLSCVIKEGQKIEGRNYSNECSNISASRFDGGKFWSMSSVSRVVDQNIGPTITHEFAHLIHNKVDPNQFAFFRGDPTGHVKMKTLMKQLKIKLSDAPTKYGQTNHSEFWAESFTAYVYAPEWLIETHPKVSLLLDKLFDEYKIEKSTITQYLKK